MIDHRLEPEHQELRKTVEQLAHDVVAPVAGDYDERCGFIASELGAGGLA